MTGEEWVAIDRETERKVWQRVMGQDTFEEDLARLLRLSILQAGDLRQLDRELYRRERLQLGLLTGLWELSQGGTGPGESAPSGFGHRKAGIMRCRDRCKEMLGLSVRLENHPRYGQIFLDLTRHRRACCAMLEQLVQQKNRRR